MAATATMGSAARGVEETPEPVPSRQLQVVVPLSLDYPLLEQLLVTQVFTGPQGSRELLDDPSGCSAIRVSEPSLSASDARLQLLATLRATVGVGGTGACSTMLNWAGRIGVSGLPQIRSDGTALGFEPQRVWLLDTSGQELNNPALLALADRSARAMFSRFVVDLEPQLRSVGDFLPDVLPLYSRQQIEALLQTLRVDALRVQDEMLDADVAFLVEPLERAAEPERPLTEAELAVWEERWQLMDALLVLAVKHYAASTQLGELRDALLDALIESRYRLRDALAETPVTGSDPVREWFVQSWQSLGPTIRSIGMEQPGQEHLLLLSVIAATDALAALDDLGPAVGLDISVDGLRRLARMINGGAATELLEYSSDVDPQLRRLLEDSMESAPPPTGWRIDLSLFPRAIAADSDRLNSWAPQRRDLQEYLPLVGALLNESAAQAARERGLDAAFVELFRQIVLTTAWQESCWRHYVVSDDRKLVPLRSGTGDVGLMQVNERVWRGFYDQQRLRWDIDYNGAAGAEVLVDYLVKYALRKGEHRQPGGVTNLARATYSAYNGGPSQVARYRSSKASAYGRKVDAAFWDKFQQVSAGNELAVSGCLGGTMSGPVTAARAPAAAAGASAPANHFTLQLGAFSTEQAARNFISQRSLGSLASVRRRSQGGAGQYLVVYGSYATRAQAESARKSLAALEPWIRPFSDL